MAAIRPEAARAFVCTATGVGVDMDEEAHERILRFHAVVCSQRPLVRDADSTARVNLTIGKRFSVSLG